MMYRDGKPCAMCYLLDLTNFPAYTSSPLDFASSIKIKSLRAKQQTPRARGRAFDRSLDLQRCRVDKHSGWCYLMSELFLHVRCNGRN